MKSWNIDPVTRDYTLTSGVPDETDGLLVPAYVRLKTKRASWLYAPNDDYGSDFHLLTKKRGGETASLIETIGVRALQPIVDDGRATGAEVLVAEEARHGLGLEITIVDSGGKQEQVTITSLGV